MTRAAALIVFGACAGAHANPWTDLTTQRIVNSVNNPTTITDSTYPSSLVDYDFVDGEVLSVMVVGLLTELTIRFYREASFGRMIIRSWANSESRMREEYQAINRKADEFNQSPRNDTGGCAHRLWGVCRGSRKPMDRPHYPADRQFRQQPHNHHR